MVYAKLVLVFLLMLGVLLGAQLGRAQEPTVALLQGERGALQGEEVPLDEVIEKHKRAADESLQDVLEKTLRDHHPEDLPQAIPDDMYESSYQN